MNFTGKIRLVQNKSEFDVYRVTYDVNDQTDVCEGKIDLLWQFIMPAIRMLAATVAGFKVLALHPNQVFPISLVPASDCFRECFSVFRICPQLVPIRTVATIVPVKIHPQQTPLRQTMDDFLQSGPGHIPHCILPAEVGNRSLGEGGIAKQSYQFWHHFQFFLHRFPKQWVAATGSLVVDRHSCLPRLPNHVSADVGHVIDLPQAVRQRTLGRQMKGKQQNQQA